MLQCTLLQSEDFTSFALCVALDNSDWAIRCSHYRYVFLCVGSLQTRSGDVCHGSARGGFHIFCPVRGAGQQCRGHEERAHQGKPISTKHIRTMLLQLPGTILFSNTKTFLLIHTIWSIIKLFDRSHSFFIHCCT